MNSDIFHSRHMRDYISSLHQVLVKNEIITNPKVLKCGQYLSKQKGYLRQRIQCDKIKLCPRCKYRSAPERIQKIISEQKKCLDSQKNLFSVSISNNFPILLARVKLFPEVADIINIFFIGMTNLSIT